jgi:NAD(P)H-nitrite reductase large subunit
MTRYVIIGGSAAGTAAVEGIRERDTAGAITIITEEKALSYGRPLISYWLERRVTDELLDYRPQSFYGDNRVEVITGTRAVRVNSSTKTVTLSSGREVEYDKLLVATGARPFVPPVEGLQEGMYHTFMTIDDARGIASELGGAPARKSALVVGAGLSGMKAAEALHSLGVDVLVVDLADRILLRILDKRASALVHGLLSQKGLKLRMATTLERTSRSDSGSGYDIRLTDGSEHEVDLIVMAVGVRPNTELIREAGGEVRRGVVVDNYLRTSLQDVYAAGDVVETANRITGQVDLSQIMPNASVQGRVAGRNMAGAEEPYSGHRAFNSLPLLGVPIATMGIVDPASLPDSDNYEIKVAEDETSGIYRKLVLRDGRLVGGIFVNSPDGLGILRHLVEDAPGFVFDEALASKALSGDLGLLDLPPSVRRERLLA